MEQDISERPFEEIVMGLHSLIERERGTKEARHYLKWANGILVFFPKGLRNIAVSGYGRVIASQGTGLADFYFAQLKDLFRLEQKNAKQGAFPLTARAAEEGAELLCSEAGKGSMMGRLLKKVFPGNAKSKRESEELFQRLGEQLSR